jgi:DNA-binding NarL/FixJ family response regulator
MINDLYHHPIHSRFVPISSGNVSIHPTNGFSTPTVRAMLMLSTALDCQSLAALLTQRRGIEVVESTAELEYGLARCRRLSPQVLMIDPQLGGDAVDQAVALVRETYVGHVIVLDDRVHEGRLAKLLIMPAVSYMTRRSGLDALQAAIMRVAHQSERVFDPAIDHRVLRTPRGLRLEQSPDLPSITALTARELEVMQRLAQGSSVRDCAQEMHLSESTIDNHKSRLMKKLRIHKAAELTHVAIREGVITV